MVFSVALMPQVADDGLRPRLPPGSHPGLSAIVDVCADYSPDMRPTFAQIVEDLGPVVNSIRAQVRIPACLSPMPKLSGSMVGRALIYSPQKRSVLA